VIFGTNDLSKLSEDDDRLIPLLEPSTNNIELNILTDLGAIKVCVSNVKIARKQNLDRRRLGVKTNLALEHHRCLEHLSGVRKAEASREAHAIVQSALQNVGATKGVLGNRDAAGLNISFGEADTFILVTQLRDKTGMDIALKESGIYMNVPSKLTTFIEWAGVHCAFLCVWVKSFHFRSTARVATTGPTTTTLLSSALAGLVPADDALDVRGSALALGHLQSGAGLGETRIVVIARLRRHLYVTHKLF
jgi:hypothetical protein